MESANLHHQHHQLQDQLVGSSAFSAPSPSYGSVASTHHAWSPNFILNTGNYINPNCNGVLLNSSREISRQKNENLISPPHHLMSSMTQDLGFHQWVSSHDHDHLVHFPKIKEELSDSSSSVVPKFTPNTTADEDFHLTAANYVKDEQEDPYTTAPNCSSTFESIDHSGPNNYRRSFSQIFPSIHVSGSINRQASSSTTSSSMDVMNLQVLDLLTSGRFSGGSFGQQAAQDDISFGLDNHAIQQTTIHGPLSNTIKMSAAFGSSGVTEAKRPISSLIAEPKASSQAATAGAGKKPRSDSRPCCPPFKVRKEKLGDRIAALQQLVAPFGKTDTASVLMEAIGYIKFLQNQVETLSVPYMKSARRRPSYRPIQGGSSNGEEGGKETEGRRDLRSRGLCLVPLSCMSYVASTHDTCSSPHALWPPPPHDFTTTPAGPGGGPLT
ncbi:transcription factor bHLH110 [Malania oleifera]|uniref:transcription factor bHLH110 n=1 Tax=Malania oleifera TaxID=397392 RepID=UPI0025AE60A3|nr:transcription factor bHLH110 [Malania oleifera]XP_057973544.1 transcription factor bHLH110 [Malania oleifera]